MSFSALLRALRVSAVLFLFVVPVAAQAPAASEAETKTTMLHLASGDILWGSIVAHDEEQLSFRRLETGGTLELPWSLLEPAQANELRLAFGYVDTAGEELMIDADRLELSDGTEVIGRIVNRTEEHLWVKRAIGTVPIAKTLVRSAGTTVQVPALDVFTKEELYQGKALELQMRLGLTGREGALAHDEVARYAERLLDYPHAVQHYQKIQELDPTYDAQRVAQSLARATEKAALQEQVDLLAEIDLWRARKRYDQALALLSSFPERFPKSPLLDDWNSLSKRVARAQERDLRAEVISRWHAWSAKLAREAARKPTFEEVLGYLDEKMGNDVLEHVKDDVQAIAPGIGVEQVKKLWDERTGGRYRQASYGQGSWLLGEAARDVAKAEDDQAAKVEAEKGTQAAERKKLEERIKRYLENQKLARESRAEKSEEEDPQTFWASWNSAGRSQWILAYYAEKSGDFRDLAPRLANCRECGGTGARDVLDLGSAMQGAKASERLVPCPTCHTIGVVRRIRYR